MNTEKDYHPASSADDANPIREIRVVKDTVVTSPTVFAWVFFEIVDNGEYNVCGVVTNGPDTERHYLKEAADTLVREHDADVVYDQSGGVVSKITHGEVYKNSEEDE